MKVNTLEPQFIRLVKLSSDAENVKTDYELERIAFHHPSEHTINGKRFPIEVQFFLKRHVGKNVEKLGVAVFGVIATKSMVTPVLVDLANVIVNSFTETGVRIPSFNPSSLLPNRDGYFLYETGTDTAPPCDAMKWIIMEHTVGFSKNMINAIRKQILRFHTSSSGNARPGRVDQTSLQIQYFPSTERLLKAAEVSMSPAQTILFAQDKLIDFSILKMEPSLFYTGQYNLKTASQCEIPKAPGLDLQGIEPNTHPDILRLRPDITMETSSATTAVPPKVTPPRIPTTQPSRVKTIPRPKEKIAEWTKHQSNTQADRVWLAKCESWKANGSKPDVPEAEDCEELFARLPPDAWIFAHVPLPPLPTLPEPRFNPSNLPVSPSTLNDGKLPEAIDPYAKSAAAPYDPNDPMSGPDLFMHKPSGALLPILKAPFVHPPV